LVAVEALVDARLALGDHAQLVPELERLAREQPFHEPVHGQLMLALYRTGRQADALAAYGRLRRTLDDELGVAPTAPPRSLGRARRRSCARSRRSIRARSTRVHPRSPATAPPGGMPCPPSCRSSCARSPAAPGSSTGWTRCSRTRMARAGPARRPS